MEEVRNKEWWLDKIAKGIAYVLTGAVAAVAVGVVGAILYYMPKGCNCSCNY
jgi:hypothetical protein